MQFFQYPETRAVVYPEGRKLLVDLRTAQRPGALSNQRGQIDLRRLTWLLHQSVPLAVDHRLIPLAAINLVADPPVSLLHQTDVHFQRRLHH